MDVANLANAALFSPPDMSALVTSSPSLSLLSAPGLAQSLASWDGGMTPGSQRTAASASRPPAEAKQLTYSFDPFDQKSWWTDATTTGTNVDTVA